MAKKYISKYTGPEIDSGLDNIPKLEGKLTELESDAQHIHTTDLITHLGMFELGNVSDTDGSLTDSPNRRRTALLKLPLHRDMPLPLKAELSDNVGVRAVWYNGNGDFISGTYNLNMPTNARYVRFVAFPNPDSSVFGEDKLFASQINIFAEALTSEGVFDNIENYKEKLAEEGISGFPMSMIEYGTFIGQGNESASTTRARTKAITKNFRIETNEEYLIYEVLEFDAKTNGFLSSATINEKTYVSNFIEGGQYVRILFRKNDNSTITDLSAIVKNYGGKIYELSNEIESLKKLLSDKGLNEGVSYDNKGLNGTENTSRIISDYIAIQHHSIYRIIIPDGFQAEYLLYKEKDNLEVESVYSTGEVIVVNGDYNYLRIYMRKPDDAKIYPYEGESVKIKSGTSEKVSLRVAQWNIGNLNYGISPTSMPDSEMAVRIPEIKNILTDLNADVLIINEYASVVNQGNNGQPRLNTYDTFMRQFFPHKYIGGNSMAIFSKYPFTCQDMTLASGSQRKYIKANIVVGTALVGVLVVHSSPYSADDRILENEEFVSAMVDYTYSIVAGDLNTGNNSESSELEDAQLAPFINGGYTLGNRGYWGEIPTYPSTQQALDNIIVKGLNIDKYKVLSEHSISDHLPTFAEVNIVL